MGTCQDEPEQLDDWNRIAELQQRNRVCPPHLKTCYPLESRVSSEVTCIGPACAGSPLPLGIPSQCHLLTSLSNSDLGLWSEEGDWMLLVEQLVGRELRGEVIVGGQELGAVCSGLFFCSHCREDNGEGGLL